MELETVIGKIKKAIGFESEDECKRMGSNPHANFEQMHPAVNKEEPASFANPIEAGAKKFSEEQCGQAMPRPLLDDLQPGSDYKCPTDAHSRLGSDPHANFEQMHPAVNKVEPASFANPCESGAKKPSEAVIGKPMPESRKFCQ